MSAPTARPPTKLVAEICPTANKFCPWAKRRPMDEGITYVHIDVNSLPMENMIHAESMVAYHHGKSGRHHQTFRLSLNDAMVSELYISANPYFSDGVMPRFVHEAYRVLESNGNLVFFNGYIPLPSGVMMGFWTKGNEGKPLHTPHLLRPNREESILLHQFFKPLDLDEHNLFLSERGLGRATELEPGMNVSVFVRKS